MPHPLHKKGQRVRFSLWRMTISLVVAMYSCSICIYSILFEAVHSRVVHANNLPCSSGILLLILLVQYSTKQYETVYNPTVELLYQEGLTQSLIN